MPEPTRSPRLDQDRFRLTPWARNATVQHIDARRHSTRATIDDAPTETPGETATLDAFGEGSE
jgi:hypothetical protein